MCWQGMGAAWWGSCHFSNFLNIYFLSKDLLPIHQVTNSSLQWNPHVPKAVTQKFCSAALAIHVQNTLFKWRRPLIVAYICARHPTLIILNKNCLYLLIIMLTSNIKSFFWSACWETKKNSCYFFFVRLHVK